MLVYRQMAWCLIFSRMYDKVDLSSFMYSESDFFGGGGDLFPLTCKQMRGVSLSH